MLDFPLITDLLPDKVKQSFAQLRDAQTLLLFRDLTYLPETGTDAEKSPPERALQQAIATFRRELQQLAQEDTAAYSRLFDALPPYLSAFQPEANLSADEIHLLQRLTEREPENQVPFAQTATGLSARVAAYRERHPPEADTTENAKRHKTALQQLREWIDDQKDMAEDQVSTQIQALQSGLEQVGRTLEILFHPVTLTTQVGEDLLQTTFGLSFDPVTALNRMPSAAAIQQHQQTVTTFLQHFQEAVHIAMQLIQWGIALGTNPINWVKVGGKIMELLQAKLAPQES
jgi:hypothetical protein